MGYSLARWLRRCQSGPYTADKSGKSPSENSRNIGQGTWPSAVTLEALFGSEQKTRSGSRSDSLSKLS